MLIRVCYDVILGLTTPHWPWTCMNELLVTAEVPHTVGPAGTGASLGPANVRGAQSLYLSLEFRY